VRCNRSDGSTETFRLDDPADADRWAAISDTPDGPRDIRAVILNGVGPEVAIKAPARFRHVAYKAEACRATTGDVVADRVTIQADDVELDVVLYRTGVARVALRRTGRPCFLTGPRREE
jgi:hypothetical protein